MFLRCNCCLGNVGPLQPCRNLEACHLALHPTLGSVAYNIRRGTLEADTKLIALQRILREFHRKPHHSCAGVRH